MLVQQVGERGSEGMGERGKEGRDGGKEGREWNRGRAEGDSSAAMINGASREIFVQQVGEGEGREGIEGRDCATAGGTGTCRERCLDACATGGGRGGEGREGEEEGREWNGGSGCVAAEGYGSPAKRCVDAHTNDRARGLESGGEEGVRGFFVSQIPSKNQWLMCSLPPCRCLDRRWSWRWQLPQRFWVRYESWPVRASALLTPGFWAGPLRCE